MIVRERRPKSIISTVHCTLYSIQIMPCPCFSDRKSLEEKEARRIFRQISTAVYYCHKVSVKFFFIF